MILLLILAVKEKSIVLIYIASFILSFLASIHGPPKMGIWADNIPVQRMERYNNLLGIFAQASAIVSPLIASFFISMELISVGFAINALTFFICAIVIVKIASPSPQLVPTIIKKPNPFSGFKLIAKETELAKFVAYDAIHMIGFGAFIATFFIAAQRDFGWSKAEYSYHLTTVAIITIFVAFITGTNYMKKIEPTTRLALSALISALSLWLVMSFRSFSLSSIVMGICDGLAVSATALTKTRILLVAKQVYPEHLSSIVSSRSIIIKGATLFGTGASLVIERFVSLEITLSLLVIPIALSALLFAGRNKKLSVSPLPIPQKIAK